MSVCVLVREPVDHHLYPIQRCANAKYEFASRVASRSRELYLARMCFVLQCSVHCICMCGDCSFVCASTLARFLLNCLLLYVCVLVCPRVCLYGSYVCVFVLGGLLAPRSTLMMMTMIVITIIAVVVLCCVCVADVAFVCWFKPKTLSCRQFKIVRPTKSIYFVCVKPKQRVFRARLFSRPLCDFYAVFFFYYFIVLFIFIWYFLYL